MAKEILASRSNSPIALLMSYNVKRINSCAFDWYFSFGFIRQATFDMLTHSGMSILGFLHIDANAR